MKKLILVLVATLVVGCVSNNELQTALNDKVNMKLLLVAVTPDYSIAEPPYYQKCYYEYKDHFVNSCSWFANSQCVTPEQQDACAALDIRLKRQGYNFSSSTFLAAYINQQNELSNQREAEEQKNINDARQQLIESMADGKNI